MKEQLADLERQQAELERRKAQILAEAEAERRREAAEAAVRAGAELSTLVKQYNTLEGQRVQLLGRIFTLANSAGAREVRFTEGLWNNCFRNESPHELALGIKAHVGEPSLITGVAIPGATVEL